MTRFAKILNWTWGEIFMRMKNNDEDFEKERLLSYQGTALCFCEFTSIFLQSNENPLSHNILTRGEVPRLATSPSLKALRNWPT